MQYKIEIICDSDDSDKPLELANLLTTMSVYVVDNVVTETFEDVGFGSWRKVGGTING